MHQRELIYNSIANAVTTACPSAYVAQRRELIPKQLPSVFIELISKIRMRNYACLDNTDDQYRMTFEVNVMADTMDSTYTLMGYVEDAFKNLGFFEEMQMPLDEDPMYYRLVARFSAQIGASI